MAIIIYVLYQSAEYQLRNMILQVLARLIINNYIRCMVILGHEVAY
jgi:hypothetical protein